MSEIIGLKRRVRGLMDNHERLLGVVVVDETRQGYYAYVLRDWEHPDPDVDARLLAERTAYLTKGDGNDGWVTSGDAVAINRRDPFDQPGRLAGAVAKVYADAKKIQQGTVEEPTIGNLTGTGQ